jgi:hypothetical protein
MHYQNVPRFPDGTFPLSGLRPLKLDNEDNEGEFNNSKEVEDLAATIPKIDGGNQCRLEPTPSATYDATFGSEGALFAIISIGFFIIVSVVGILMVVCCQTREPVMDVTESISESMLDSGEEELVRA